MNDIEEKEQEEDQRKLLQTQQKVKGSHSICDSKIKI